MSRYIVYISPQAYRDIDEIYEYIKTELFAEDAAARLVDDIEEAILSLEEMPERGAERRTGTYAYKGYRQLFVKNYTIVYRVDADAKDVMIIKGECSWQLTELIGTGRQRSRNIARRMVLQAN